MNNGWSVNVNVFYSSKFVSTSAFMWKLDMCMKFKLVLHVFSKSAKHDLAE